MSNAIVLCLVLPLLVSACVSGRPSPDEPLFQFGLFADAQYADKNTAGSRTYREALPLLEACAKDLATHDLAFIAQLGDLIDGRQTDELSMVDLNRALAPLEATGHKLLHAVGNHCLAVPRSELKQRLGIQSTWASHHYPGWRFLVLDSMAFSLQGDDVPQAAAWLEAHQDAPQAKKWNGGFGPDQLAWLEAQLQDAEQAGAKVAIFAHHPIEAAASSAAHLAWDHAEAHALITASPATVAYFAGHDHAGGYAVVQGVHFWTLPAMLESTAAPNAYAIVEAWPDHLQVNGIGEVQSRKLER